MNWHDAQEGLSRGRHPMKEQLQLVIAAVHPSIGQQAYQVQRPACGCRRNVLPAIQLKELATLQRLVHQPGPLVHLLQNYGVFTTRKGGLAGSSGLILLPADDAGIMHDKQFQLNPVYGLDCVSCRCLSQMLNDASSLRQQRHSP